MSTIGQRIKIRREELGLSQEELGKRLGYKSRSSINKIELDQRNLTQSKIKSIADALETTPSYIMGWEEDCTPQEPPAHPVFKEPLKTAVNLFQQLDTADQNKVIGRMETMLEDNKYQTQRQAQKA